MQLKDKVIIITGGCQGLGRAMAEYLAGKGTKLALIDLNPEKLELAVAACQAHGVEARAYLCNVADEEQVIRGPVMWVKPTTLPPKQGLLPPP